MAFYKFLRPKLHILMGKMGFIKLMVIDKIYKLLFVNDFMKILKIYPRDIIALIVLIFAMMLISKGINHVVSGIVIMIVTYYFAQRTSEEKNPENDIHEKTKKILKIVDELKENNIQNPIPQKPFCTGDFKLKEPEIKPTNQQLPSSSQPKLH